MCRPIWQYLRYCNRLMMLLGSKRAFFEYNKLRHLVSIEGGFIKLRDAYIPTPTIDDILVWDYEFIDIVAPYLFYSAHEYRYEELEPIFNEGPYEIDSNVCIREGDVVVDCGANLGMFSAVAIAKGASLVYAFEPLKEIAESRLAETTAKNPGISVCNYAVSDSVGTAEFIVNTSNIGGSGLRNNSVAAHAKNHIEEVNVTTLDDFVKRNHIKRIDFIKCDIEGAERNMLRGAKLVMQNWPQSYRSARTIIRMTRRCSSELFSMPIPTTLLCINI